MNRAAQRTIMATAPLVMALLCGGCLKESIVVEVRPDGSGRIVVERLFTPKFDGYLISQIRPGQKQNGELGEEAFSPELGKALAFVFGPGARYVEREAIDKNEMPGTRVVYAFDDVRNVQIPLGDIGLFLSAFIPMNLPTKESEKRELPEDIRKLLEESNAPGTAFHFGFESDEYSTLTIHGATALMDSLQEAELDPAGWERSAAVENSATGSWGDILGLGPDATEGECIRTAYGGMEMRVAVRVVGELIETDAAYRNEEVENEIVLYDLEMDKVLDSPEGPRLVNRERLEGKAGALGRAFLILAKSKHVRCEKKETVTVRFKATNTE